MLSREIVPAEMSTYYIIKLRVSAVFSMEIALRLVDQAFIHLDLSYGICKTRF